MSVAQRIRIKHMIFVPSLFLSEYLGRGYFPCKRAQKLQNNLRFTRGRSVIFLGSECSFLRRNHESCEWVLLLFSHRRWFERYLSLELLCMSSDLRHIIVVYSNFTKKKSRQKVYECFNCDFWLETW